MARKRPPRFHGLFAVDKPAGPTSHDVVAWLRWVLNERAVGHCGTLDPAATGLLVVCVGPATRLAGVLTQDDKTYEARICLGASTTTADAEGEVVQEAPVTEHVRGEALTTLEGMVGSLELAPPAYSAIRVDGVRAHELAREGGAVELPPRQMIIRELSEHSLVEGAGEGRLWVDATLRVSKGSYIRSIAEELGRRLGVPAHLAALRRTRCGAVELSGAGSIDPGATMVDKRWRLGAKLGVEGREAMREKVEPKVLDPLGFLPIGKVAVDGDAARAEALRRLAIGQKIGVVSSEGQSLASALGASASDDPAEHHFYLLGDHDEQGLRVAVEVMGRGPQGPHGPAYLPLRVLRLPRPGTLTGPAQGA